MLRFKKQYSVILVRVQFHDKFSIIWNNVLINTLELLIIRGFYLVNRQVGGSLKGNITI